MFLLNGNPYIQPICGVDMGQMHRTCLPRQIWPTMIHPSPHIFNHIRILDETLAALHSTPLYFPLPPKLFSGEL